jgi:hypothetical protein
MAIQVCTRDQRYPQELFTPECSRLGAIWPRLLESATGFLTSSRGKRPATEIGEDRFSPRAFQQNWILSEIRGTGSEFFKEIAGNRRLVRKRDAYSRSDYRQCGDPNCVRVKLKSNAHGKIGLPFRF